MVIRVAVCLILAALTAPAQWQRYVNTERGAWTDKPIAHNPAYFRIDPCARTDEKIALLQCNPYPSAEELKGRLKMRTDLEVVGTIGSFTIYDLFYLDPDLPDPFARSVLVKTAPNQLHEIHIGANSVRFGAEIVEAGQQHIIKVKYEDEGNLRFVNEYYFVILKEGAVLLDFAPVIEAASKAPSSDMVTYQPTSKFDLDSLVFRIQTERRDITLGEKVSCCEGRVEAPFKLEHGRVIPGVAKYFPPGQ